MEKIFADHKQHILGKIMNFKIILGLTCLFFLIIILTD